MSEFTALILAAGLGLRMGPRGKLVPKGLIEMGGRALVPQSVDTLRRAGVTRIAVVTGHLAEQYQEVFAGTDIQIIHNPDYATTGSLRTLATGLAACAGPVLILESDLVYAPQVLTGLEPSRNSFTVSGPTQAGDEVYTWVRDDRLIEISKDRNARPEPPLGEMIGITALTAAATSTMQGVAQRVLAEAPEAHYEQGLVALAQEVEIACPFLGDIAWAEVDDEQMLARARAEVYPAIEAARRAAWKGIE
ncbi:putative nucleotidyl transferase [Candidatus Rhodobacter oscarellae]|uniref:Putative nucleotidyl transferase n=1 Tax=Candidatus Rhodobacter oscarellae TaxID=1675527 RepID=A0A0J9E3M1_9RHOB|nr:phosphocholine cytidylyltransferase family protein [Candidatus Rhodobacter lobularis]KMW57390.1 putative nucleotidyl transferase [Candidatus Rhodobacter lobularis]